MTNFTNAVASVLNGANPEAVADKLLKETAKAPAMKPAAAETAKSAEKPAAKTSEVKETKPATEKKPAEAKAPAAKQETKAPSAKAETAKAEKSDDDLSKKKIEWVGFGAEKANPCRDGGARHARYELLKACNGQTVATFIRKAEKDEDAFGTVAPTASLANAEKLGFVKLK